MNDIESLLIINDLAFNIMSLQIEIKTKLKNKDFIRLIKDHLRFNIESEQCFIIEYFEELESNLSLIPGKVYEKSEVRRLIDWFERKFYHEVTFPLLNNRIIKRFVGEKNPSSEIIRGALQNLKIHLPYLEWLTENRKWVAEIGRAHV